MEAIMKLSAELYVAASESKIQLCVELSEKIHKIMETYKRSC